MNMRSFKAMGVRNAGWGICGFTSAIYAMYDTNPGLRGRLINAPKPFTILAEMKTYLEMLYGAQQTDLLDEIERFTRAFGVVNGFDFSTFTPRSYILYINSSLTKYINQDNGATVKAIVDDPKFSIGLHPEAVADYLQRIWGRGATVHAIDPGGDALIGVKDVAVDNGPKLHGGLCHWVYRRNNKIYSWGNEYASLTEADGDFAFCSAVKLA